MIRKPKCTLSILVVLAGLPAMVLLVQPASVRAQHYVGQDGRGAEANPMVGSGGRNSVSPAGLQNQQGLNNSIVTRNVSGLNYFHGRAGTFDPNVFQGRGANSPSDVLNTVAAPVNINQRTTGMPNYTTFYVPQTYTAPAPQNFVPTPGGNTGFVPGQVVDPLTPDTDMRLELTNTDPTRGNLPLQGELQVSGPVDPTGAGSLYSMSPLYGMRQQENGANPGTADSLFQSKQTNTLLPNATNGNRLTPAQIKQLREELNKTMVPDEKDNSGAPTLDKGSQIPATPLTGLVSTPPINSALGGGPANAGNLSTGEGQQSQLLIAPGKQSKQLKALEDKYAKLNRKLTDTEATEKLNQEERALHANTPLDKNGKKPVAPTAIPGANPAGDLSPSAGPVEPTTKPALKPILKPEDVSADNQPYIITSLATGISAKGLADLMKSAEDKMRQGKFTEAVDTYETAQSVAPNNPFVALGRSFAELGASYYGKSDQDLTRAIVADPAILAGRYDLNGFLGEDRVKFITKDLTDIAGHEKSGRPLVLLGFIAHNLGDDAGAATYLDQASPRGGYDSLITLMRSTWNLKSAGK